MCCEGLRPSLAAPGLNDQQRWRLQPRLEATVRLKYASVLHEETDNYMEAETVLSTGVGVGLSNIE